MGGWSGWFTYYARGKVCDALQQAVAAPQATTETQKRTLFRTLFQPELRESFTTILWCDVLITLQTHSFLASIDSAMAGHPRVSNQMCAVIVFYTLRIGLHLRGWESWRNNIARHNDWKEEFDRCEGFPSLSPTTIILGS